MIWNRIRNLIGNGDKDLLTERNRLLEKLKSERNSRQRLETQLAGANEENAVLKRKRLEVTHAGIPGAAGADARFESLRALAYSKLDGAETRAKIASYHASLEKKGYDHVWRERIKAILGVLATGESRLPRVVAQVRRGEERRRNMSLDARTWVINDQPMELPWRFASACYRSVVAESVIDRVRPDTTKIIETGSGWGEHLCNIFLEGGPIEATYYALELEEEGRNCALLLAALEPMLRLEARYFDYVAPDYSSLPRDDAHTILMTVHSVEQVANIHPDCIRSALELGRDVTGIHVEPVGWQLSEEKDWSPISRTHHERCMSQRYNTNLWTLLKGFEEEKLIRILDVRKNFVGLDYNPASLIVWEKVR
jgi:hypothetical protein